MTLELRPMTDTEFDRFSERLTRSYTESQVTSGRWRSDDAERLMRETMADLLPDGRDTAGMLLRSAERDGDGPVGSVWVALESPGGVGAWIFDIEIFAPFRGAGLGRALLEATENLVAAHGIGEVGLNVFGANTVARALYDSSGYELVSAHLRKTLPVTEPEGV